MANESIDFYLFTDNDIKTEKNLFVYNMTFEKYCSLLKEKIFSECVCERAYKLCDYKPAIGVIFDNILKDYDYWGHCDVDMYFGDIRKFITDDLLINNERIFKNGFLTLYRNTEKMNYLFMNDGEYPEFNYKEAYSTNYPCFFDEYSGMGLKCIRNKIKEVDDSFCLDLAVGDYQFHNHRGEQIVCIWDNGKLYELAKDGKKTEKIFVHIQKRKMEIEGDLSDRFLIAPGKIQSTDIEFDDGWFEINQGKGYKRKYWLNRLFVLIKEGSFFWRIKKALRIKQQFKYERKIRGIQDENL